MRYIRPYLRHWRSCRSRGIGRVRRRPRRAGARRPRPGRPAGTTRGRPASTSAVRRLRLVFVLPRLPPGPVRVVARVLPPNDDAGRDAGNRRGQLRRRHRRQCPGVADAAGATRPAIVGRFRRPRRRGKGSGTGVGLSSTPADRSTSGDDHRIPQPADLLVRDGKQPRARAAPGHLVDGGPAVDPTPRGGHASARAVAHVRNRQLEWRLRRLPYDQRSASTRHTVRVAADPHASRRHTRRGVRHLVRGVPWAGRAAPPRQPQPAAPVRPPPHRPRRFHGRAADAPESASVVAGLRAVPLLLGVLQSAERAASQRARAALPARGRARPTSYRVRWGRGARRMG